MHGIFRRRDLPHGDVDGAPYFITACLAGSVPALGMSELKDYRRQLDRQPKPRTLSTEEWERRMHKLMFVKLDEILDHRPAVHHLDQKELATIVRDSMQHFAGERYELLPWVVMPSHIHWVFQPLPAWSSALPRGKSAREVIMHSLKSFTATMCNRVLARRGRFWQDESWDHWIRDEEELERVIAYLENNPMKAGLVTSPEEYEFSSAFGRPVG